MDLRGEKKDSIQERERGGEGTGEGVEGKKNHPSILM
jgi:hypothetical protein